MSTSARDLAVSQSAGLWAGAAAILAGASSAETMNAVVVKVRSSDPSILSIAAEPICGCLGSLDASMIDLVLTEAARRPERWRPPLRRALDAPNQATQLAAAGLLDIVGAQEDVPRLRKIARTVRAQPGSSDLGRSLAHRIAARVRVVDLWRVQLRIGDRVIDGGTARRKVLSLLCYLITRSGLSATREEVLDALGPELSPTTALNSLNQTVYFLRRVFEPTFSEDLTAGYVGQDGETVGSTVTSSRATA